MKHPSIRLFLCLVFALSSGLSAAELGFSRHYSDGMVLQRDKPVTLRGFADKGATVTVTFGGQSKEAKADGNGVWKVDLDAMPANSTGAELTVNSGGKLARLGDVVVGDVFLFARQSTINVSLGRDEAGKKAAADLPSVRVMMVKTIPATEPQNNLAAEATSGWATLDKQTALKMNSAAYHVAAGLSKEVDVPIGIIDLNLGYHYPIAWLGRDSLAETESIYGKKASTVDGMIASMEKTLAEYENVAKRKEMEEKRTVPLAHPSEDPRFPSAGYNGVLHPMRDLTLKGLLLQLGNDYPYTAYQDIERAGKVTSRPHLGLAYLDAYEQRKSSIHLDPLTVPRLPRVWRSYFGDEALPVGWVTPPGSDLVTMGRHHYETRELQRRTADKEDGVELILSGAEHVPFSAQPADEALLGKRCLAWLKGAVYGKEGVAATGPQFERATMNYATAQIFFKPGTAKGLKAEGDALDYFEAAGSDMEFSPAKAKIDGETIRLSSGTVQRIAYVRYNWTEKPNQGLVNASGLPAIPFNSDGHEFPRTLNTVGEEKLPIEFFTPISEWKSDGAVIANGRLIKDYKVGRALGPTGLRTSFFGPNLYVNSVFVGSPAHNKIFPGDYLFGVDGEVFEGHVHKQVAAAIDRAESEEQEGKITFDVMRNGKKIKVTLQLEVLGSYSPTSPYDCPKSDRIVANAEKLLAKHGGVIQGHPVFQNPDAMFLLSAGSPEYQGLVRRHIYNILAKWDPATPVDPLGKKAPGGPWGLSADMLLMSEYYLATGDQNVLAYMKFACDALTSIQIRTMEEKGPWPEVQPGQTGGWRHNFYGGTKYGTIRAISAPALIGYHLTKEAGVEYDFTGYERTVGWHLHNGVRIGVVPYGYFAKPLNKGNHVDPDKLAEGKLDNMNGCASAAAIVFGWRGDGDIARTCAFVSTHSYNNTSGFHGGHFWSNLYTPLGARVESKKSFEFFMRNNRWYQDIHRMHDHSREFERGFNVGQLLAYTVPRQRLRITGAPESVFGVNPPKALEAALASYRKRDYAAAEKAAIAAIESGDIHGADLGKAEQLRDAAVLIQKSIALDLMKVKALIADGKPYEASLDIPQLKAVLPEGDAELAALEQELAKPDLKQTLNEDKKRYDEAIKALKLQLVEPKAEEGGLEWQSLVTREDLRRKKDGEERPSATVWKMKIVEAFPLAPKGWTENNFDDSEWIEATMPISWRTNHTALFRASFDVKDKNAIKSLRLRQWAFRQEDMQVYINGELVAKITPSGSGGKEMEVELNDHALKLLKNGRNTLSATYKNTWRWGRYFRGKDSVYNQGVHLILEMLPKN